jgi:alpha-glucoside transport system substrate-binding protein
MIADGFTPWCLGMESFGATGWVGTDWVEDIILRFSGPEFYDQWTAGAVGFGDDRVRDAFEEFGAIALTPGWVAGGRRAVLTVPALDAIQPMFDDPPGCLLTRQGSFQEGALPAGIEVGPQGDVDVFVLPPVDPGSAPLLVSGEIAAAFTDSDEARALVGFLASPEAGAPWAIRGGYTSPLQGFDSALYGSELERRLGELVSGADIVRFDGSDLMPPEVGTGTFWRGIVDYVAGEPLDTVLETIQAGYGDATP